MLKEQIDRLAAENNLYRRLFLKVVKALSEEEMREIFPDYDKNPQETPKKEKESWPSL